MQWKDRFNTVLLPLINRMEAQVPVKGGESEDASPRPSEVAQEDPHIPEAAVGAGQLQRNNGLPPSPKQEALRKTLKRRASDPVVSFSTMGQSQTTSIFKRPVSRQSLPQGVKVPQGLSFDSVVNHTSPSEQPHTPVCLSTLARPPRSAKGHPTKDVTSSPRVRTDAEVSPAEQHVRVQQWRADVSRHATGESATDEDQAVQVQIQNEISEKTPPLPCYSKSTPSPILDNIVGNKRKREVHNGGLVTPKTLLTKRVKVAVQVRTQISRNTSQNPSISPGPDTVRPELVAPIPKADNNRELYYKMSTQAIYDSITSDEEELLVNEEIAGLEDGIEEEGPKGFVSRLNGDVFNRRKSKGANRGKGLKKTTGTLDFGKGPESFEMDGVSDQGSEDVDEEIARREVTEAAIYLVEKAAQWGVSQKDVITAIERTSGEKMLVDVVLKLKTENKGILNII